jgi:matrixin
MRRLELVFGAVVTALAVFVAVEARGARVYSEYLGGAVSAPIANAAVEPRRVRPAESPVAGELAPPRDIEEIRRRLREGAPGTYVNELLLQRDSALARWHDRRSNPLRVWVQPDTPTADFSAGYPEIVRTAFDEWASTGIPLTFVFVRDSAKADVHVTWIDRFDEQISGKTLWAHDDDWWIVEANIVLAIHHRGGEPLDSSAVRAIALHEVGHLIGLDHTADTANIMTPKVRVKELSDADRATARLLYALPPGKVK